MNIAPKTHNDLLQRFVHAWLEVAGFHADGKVKSDDDAKRFLIEAWEAFKRGESAHEFGAAWK